MDDDKRFYKIYVWAIIENIAVIIVTAVLFYATRFAWCFTLLLLINTIKSKTKSQS